MKAKEIFDKKYEYYRNMLNKPAIPLEARQLIFDCMEDYKDAELKEAEKAIEQNESAIRMLAKQRDEMDAKLKEARVQFKRWQEKAEVTAKDFEQRNMSDSQLTSEAMAMAYKFCFDFLNKQDKEE